VNWPLALAVLLSTACTSSTTSTTDAAVDSALIDIATTDIGAFDAPITDIAPDAAADTPSDASAETSPDSGPDTPDVEVTPDPSRCDVGDFTITCEHTTDTLFTGVTGFTPRQVHHQVPLGDAPAAGWPVAILFQGSLFTAEFFWTVVDAPFGAFNQGLLTKTLLDRGYAVVTPEVLGDGTTAWQTNVPPASLGWGFSEDHYFMLDLFAAIEDGDFGNLDANRLFAAGISSGGYMTSRMDVEYRERFTALAIHSGSYATCAGAVCTVPSDLDAEHLPTLFLHGSLDLVVPQSTMELYRDVLAGLGVTVDTVLDEGAAHEWIDAAPTAIADWFDSY